MSMGCAFVISQVMVTGVPTSAEYDDGFIFTSISPLDFDTKTLAVKIRVLIRTKKKRLDDVDFDVVVLDVQKQNPNISTSSLFCPL